MLSFYLRINYYFCTLAVQHERISLGRPTEMGSGRNLTQPDWQRKVENIRGRPRTRDHSRGETLPVPSTRWQTLSNQIIPRAMFPNSNLVLSNYLTNIDSSLIPSISPITFIHIYHLISNIGKNQPNL